MPRHDMKHDIRGREILEHNIPKKDIADSVDIYPAVIGNPMFKALHSELLNLIRGCGGNILVLGIGPMAAPYAENPDALGSALGNDGRMLAVDYNPKVIRKAVLHLWKKGHRRLSLICDEDSFCLRDSEIRRLVRRRNLYVDTLENIGGIIDLRAYEPGTIVMLEHNLNRPLPVRDSMFHAVDATLTLHHVAAYRHQLLKVLRGILRKLKPGGILCYGDVFIDLRVSEANIRRIASIAAKALQERLTVHDLRDSDYPMCLDIMPGQNASVPVPYYCNKKRRRGIFIDMEGNITLPYHSRTLSALRGYPDKRTVGGRIILPIIDRVKDSRHIAVVRDFHKHVRSLKMSMRGFTKEEKKASIERGRLEELNCLRGLHEYFSSRHFARQVLKEAGFSMIREKTVYRPYVGMIVAVRPHVVTTQ